MIFVRWSVDFVVNWWVLFVELIFGVLINIIFLGIGVSFW